MANKLQKFYQNLFVEHGPNSHESLSYMSQETQEIRFEQLAALLSDQEEKATLLDVGCGFADFNKFIKEKGFNNIEYTGLDVIKEFVETAQKRYPELKFIDSDFLKFNTSESYDYVVSSGSLNIIIGEHQDQYDHVFKMIDKMFEVAKKGIAFNMLSEKGKDRFPFDERFFYFDPEKVYNYCRQETGDSQLIEDYLFYDFTIRMRKI